jgi:protein gp37
VKTKIQWVQGPDGAQGRTWNPVPGCQKASDECANCYAIRQVHRMGCNPSEKLQQRYGGITRKDGLNIVWTGRVTIDTDVLTLPLRVMKPTTWFISLSDLFYPGRSDDDILAVFRVMAATQRHTYQILTKYPERMHAFLAGRRWRNLGRVQDGHDFYAPIIPGEHRADDAEFLPNVWLGISAGRQKKLDERTPWLSKTPAALRFLSLEPLLEDLNLRLRKVKGFDVKPVFDCATCGGSGSIGVPGGGMACPTCYDDTYGGVGYFDAFDWVIVGGESGPGARRCHVEWIRWIVKQCQLAGVPVFVKQLGRIAVTDWGKEDAEWPTHIEQAHDEAGPCDEYVYTRDPKGGDWNEWAADLRVREMPRAA